MIADLVEIQGKKSGKVTNTDNKPQRVFTSPFTDIQLLKDYLKGDGKNIFKLADDRYISPGQAKEKINMTARALVSYLNENIDPEILQDIYKHKDYFLRSINDYAEQKNFNDPYSIENNIITAFETFGETKQMMILNKLESIMYSQREEK